RLEDILRRICARPLLSGFYADAAGAVRFVEPTMSWDDFLDLAFTEITCYGAGSPQVVRGLLAAYDVIEQGLSPQLRQAVQRKRESLLQQAADRGVEPELTRPDAMGLG